MNREPSRVRRERDTSELVAAVRRLLKALGRRAGSEDPEVLAQLQELRNCVEAEIVNTVRVQRSYGVTWEQIGAATGTTRQAAIMKWGPRL